DPSSFIYGRRAKMWSGRKGAPVPYQLIYSVFQMYEDCQAPQGAEMIHFFSVFCGDLCGYSLALAVETDWEENCRRKAATRHVVSVELRRRDAPFAASCMGFGQIKRRQPLHASCRRQICRGPPMPL